jgi:hypothetical protein
MLDLQSSEEAQATQPPPLWDYDQGRAVVSSVIRRVAQAHDGTPKARRLDAHRLLRPADVELWDAWRAQDLARLRRAADNYLALAGPIFRTYHAHRQTSA